ncbi:MULTISPECIES: GspH/FimT family pseudopilin [Xanthomonas]|uniref:Type II secretion system protein H n=1 Tax=Xanthomonas cannabis pv. phaseoli TaxID=1885902 RepID=A0AB34PD83_9XANT|nr:MULTISPECIES: GspH/FimT family pseudopilin [Xanthomonas]KGK59470.1 pre-pilin like leader sequence [Xanthomonas cannabis pv. phaseoli]PPU35312.1 pre-pilin like leader sequence [Xanthomonas sp. CFBP 7912]RJS05353.1 prepilin-type N-terminal cleavage/methylation domain-containing protein [Xanthomonas sp. CFBP 7698]
MNQLRVRGFTLVELLVTIAVVAVLAAIALPSFRGVIRSNQAATTANELVASLALARSEAIRSTRGGGICPSSDGTTCGGQWSSGWIAWSDANANGALDVGETVLRYTKVNPNITVTGTGVTAVAFDARARRLASADQVLTLRPGTCPSGQELVRTVTVTSTGHTRIVKSNC